MAQIYPPTRQHSVFQRRLQAATLQSDELALSAIEVGGRRWGLSSTATPASVRECAAGSCRRIGPLSTDDYLMRVRRVAMHPYRPADDIGRRIPSPSAFRLRLALARDTLVPRDSLRGIDLGTFQEPRIERGLTPKQPIAFGSVVFGIHRRDIHETALGRRRARHLLVGDSAARGGAAVNFRGARGRIRRKKHESRSQHGPFHFGLLAIIRHLPPRTPVRGLFYSIAKRLI